MERYPWLLHQFWIRITNWDRHFVRTRPEMICQYIVLEDEFLVSLSDL